jgi:hypothetical protein
MTITNKKFTSLGGFSVNDVTVINELRDIENVNTLQLQNRNYSDAFTKVYILKGTNTEILTLDGIELISLPNNTMNFATAHIVAVDDNSGSGNYVVKLESAVSVNGVGNVTVLSSLTTIIKDTIPAAQTWSVTPYDSGDVNRYSYSATKSGGVQSVKWIAHVSITTVAYA